MTASTLTCFRCSLFEGLATGCVKDDYTAVRPGVNASACMPAIRFFDNPKREMAGPGRSKPYPRVTSVPSAQRSTSITGLTGLQTYYFRYRTLTRAGAGDFSQAVSLVVL